MSDERLPLLIEAEHLEDLLGEEGLLIVDLSREQTYAELHVPGAIHLDYAALVQMQKPVMGLNPDEAPLSETLSAIGLTPESYVIAYDDEGGGKAARLLWTLELIGHPHYALLNGGLHTWANDGHPLERTPNAPSPSDYQAHYIADHPALADADYILAHLDDPRTALLDVRSELEYQGIKRFAERGGHIPGAVNIEWTQFMDQGRNLRLMPDAECRALLEAHGIDRDKEVITYCQTHHRSAYSWFVLHYLGYAVRGYPGSWSDWGNREGVPVEGV